MEHWEVYQGKLYLLRGRKKKSNVSRETSPPCGFCVHCLWYFSESDGDVGTTGLLEVFRQLLRVA